MNGKITKINLTLSAFSYAPLWIGYTHGNQTIRIGISREPVHNMTQNMVHKLFNTQNYYMNYDDFNRWAGMSRDRIGGYFYYGFRNPLSLWDY
jgi:hypothetical protein